jgi:glutamate synthase domain-containing protein 2
LPDPTDPSVQIAFKEEGIREFERHSRLGMVDYESFAKSVEHYRSVGAKFISLKTGAYKTTDLARALKFCSDAGVDFLTMDGAGGGTGMSPWRMMNEWGIPTIYLQSIAYKFASQLKAKGKYVPDLAIAGGFSLEDHIFKALALGAPFFKAVCMGRSLMIPAFVGKNIQKWMQEDKLPADIKKYGESPEKIFIAYETLKAKFGKDFEKIPFGAIAMYTFSDRLKVGLQQLMAGARKFAIQYLDRSDLVSLTKEAAEVTGIPYVMEADMEEAERILFS